MLLLSTETTSSFDWNTLWQNALDWISTSGVKLLLALVGVLVLCKIINVLAKKVKNSMEKKNADKTITNVVYNVIKKGLKILLFIGLIGFLGFDTTSVGAAIASVGVAIGLAFQGALSNLAGGLLIILLRPIGIGDYIEGQGVSGTVEDISIFYTYLVTPDNKVIMVPNGTLLNGNITNYSKKPTRRVDMTFDISYNADHEKAIAIISELFANNELVLKDPAPFVKLTAHKDSSIQITARAWANAGDYWTIFFFMQEQVKKRFDEEKIEIPYPQIDVHIDNKIK